MECLLKSVAFTKEPLSETNVSAGQYLKKVHDTTLKCLCFNYRNMNPTATASIMKDDGLQTKYVWFFSFIMFSCWIFAFLNIFC